MSNKFVRISGNDSNDGLSPATAWRTVSKALGAAGISSGDTLYIGAGVYSEMITIGVTPATETFVLGDIYGLTGDSGKVVIVDSKNASTGVLRLNGKSFLTFKNIEIVSKTIPCVIAVATSTNIKFQNCYFNGITTIASLMSITSAYGIAIRWLVEFCYFNSSAYNFIGTIFATGTGQDYSSDFIVRNCIFIGSGSNSLGGSGTSQGEGGNVNIINCIFIQSVPCVTSYFSAVIGGRNFSVPNYVYNCISYIRTSTSPISSAEIGALIENYNMFYGSTTARTLVVQGLQTPNANAVVGGFELGWDFWNGYSNKYFCMPEKGSKFLCRGDIMIAPEVDMLGNNFINGAVNLIKEGNVTSSNINSLTDTNNNFGSGYLQNLSLKILNGAAKDETKTIYDNTSTGITINGQWINNPSANDKYVVYNGPISTNSYVSTGTLSTLTDNYCIWETNFWKGFTMMITSGIASGQNFIVSGNSSNTLTGFYPLSIIPNTGDVYELFWGGMLKGKVSTGTSYEITDNYANWPVTLGWPTGSFWFQKRCMVIDGVAAGKNFCISGNNSNTLSGWNLLDTLPNSGDTYIIYSNTGVSTGYYPSYEYPNYNRHIIHPPVGCYSVINTAIKETGIVASGGNSLRLFGPGLQEFQIPISGVTNLSVMAYYDDYYFGDKPKLIIKNGTGLSIADNSVSMNGNSGQWEQINLLFTGNSAGIITAQLVSSCTGIGGSAYFDCLTVS